MGRAFAMNASASGRTVPVRLGSERVVSCVFMAFEIMNWSGVVGYFLWRFTADEIGTELITVFFCFPEDSEKFICSLRQKL